MATLRLVRIKCGQVPERGNLEDIYTNDRLKEGVEVLGRGQYIHDEDLTSIVKAVPNLPPHNSFLKISMDLLKALEGAAEDLLASIRADAPEDGEELDEDTIFNIDIEATISHLAKWIAEHLGTHGEQVALVVESDD
ncbi:MAG: hypothetical protein WC797_00280 [Candidatus Paceibacterota bacterium]|jgi:hypothetical protein